jgi:hypothetical protein
VSQAEYKLRTEKFWSETKSECQWWTQEYGSAQGLWFFWQLAETQWLWDTLVKGWTPSEAEMAELQEEALWMTEFGGNTDGVWTYDDEVKVTPVGYKPEEGPQVAFDFSWVDYKVPAECPF